MSREQLQMIRNADDVPNGRGDRARHWQPAAGFLSNAQAEFIAASELSVSMLGSSRAPSKPKLVINQCSSRLHSTRSTRSSARANIGIARRERLLTNEWFVDGRRGQQSARSPADVLFRRADKRHSLVPPMDCAISARHANVGLQRAKERLSSLDHLVLRAVGELLSQPERAGGVARRAQGIESLEVARQEAGRTSCAHRMSTRAHDLDENAMRYLMVDGSASKPIVASVHLDH